MRIYVKVKPKSAQKKVEKIDENQFEVKLTALPQKGEANKQLIKVLSEYFQVAKSRIEIVGGKSTSNKIVDII